MQAMTIVIPVRNNWALTASCLQSLCAHPPGIEYEVVVVDNASTDETRNFLPRYGAEWFGNRFRSIRNDDNRNFAGACNRGATGAAYDLLFFLNNDTLLTPGWDAPLIGALREDDRLGAVGPLLLFDDDTVQHLGAAVYPDKSIAYFYAGIPGGHRLARKRRSLNFITGAALLLRGSVFFEAGAFHEGYRNGLEDVELCYRLRRAGYELSVIPESRVYHFEGRTRGDDPGGAQNAPLLRERCPDIRRPEFHRIAAEDGYTTCLGPFFEPLLTPAGPGLEVCREALSAGTKKAFETALAREIFWLDGYMALAALRERDGELDSALQTLVRCSRFYLVLPVMESICRLAVKVGDQPLAERYAHLVHMAKGTLKNRDFFRFRYGSIMDSAVRWQDESLKTLLAEWRETYGSVLLPDAPSMDA